MININDDVFTLLLDQTHDDDDNNNESWIP